MNINNTWKLLENLYFERLGGTSEELEAAKRIQQALKEDLGLDSTIEAFDVIRSNIKKVSFEVLEPYQKTYHATAYMNCVDVDNLELDLHYFEVDHPVSRKMVNGKCALISGYLGLKMYKALCESNAKAFITYNGDADFGPYDVDDRELRALLKECGDLPGVHISTQDAMELVEKQASKVRITVEQEVYTCQSHNVICDIKGESEDWIVCTAHYDSVPNSKGAYDNATGSVCLYGMAENLKDKSLKHNVRFVWCGSEERGLLGSKAYVQMHKEELEHVKLCVNIDMIGTIMGSRIAVSTADMSLVHFIDYYGKMVGFPINSSQGVYSSDSTPFADAGVPAMSFARWTNSDTGRFHCRYDVMEHLSKRMLKEDIEFISQFTETMANAYVIPVVREMPQNMKDELDKYLGRTLLKK